jgi:hypothetical protein
MDEARVINLYRPDGTLYLTGPTTDRLAS